MGSIFAAGIISFPYAAADCPAGWFMTLSYVWSYG